MPDAPPAAPTSGRKLSLVWPEELEQMVFDDSDLIMGDRLLCKGSNMVMVGPPGIGKSRLCTQMQFAIAAGWPFIGWSTRPPGRHWLVIQTQNSDRRLAADVLAMRDWLGPENWAKYKKAVHFHTIRLDHDAFLNLETVKNQTLLKETIQSDNPCGVSWDPLADFMIGDPNRDIDMFATVAMMSQITRWGDPTRMTVILHHAQPGRLGAARAVGWERGGFARNSKALLGWARCIINLAPGTEDGRTLVVSCGKVSDSKDFKPFAIRLNPATMVYEVDPEFNMLTWQADMARPRAPIISNDAVAELAGPGKTRKELEEAIMQNVNCSQSAAYNSIKRAVSAKTISEHKVGGRQQHLFVASITST